MHWELCHKSCPWLCYQWTHQITEQTQPNPQTTLRIYHFKMTVTSSGVSAEYCRVGVMPSLTRYIDMITWRLFPVCMRRWRSSSCRRTSCARCGVQSTSGRCSSTRSTRSDIAFCSSSSTMTSRATPPIPTFPTTGNSCTTARRRSADWRPATRASQSASATICCRRLAVRKWTSLPPPSAAKWTSRLHWSRTVDISDIEAARGQKLVPWVPQRVGLVGLIVRCRRGSWRR